MTRTSAIVLLTVVSSLAVSPAFAQFDNIFRGGPFEIIFGGPPRPPANVPDRPPVQQDPRYIPPPEGLQQPGPPPGSRLRSEPLPPPPGASAPLLRQEGLPGDAAVLPPGSRPQRGAPQAALPGPPPPPDEVIIEPSAQKIVNPTAMFSGLDKITGRIIKFDVAIDETVRFGALEVTPRACYSRPPTETPVTDAFIEVDEVTLQGDLKRIFTGWIFAASPGLNAVEHPIYDVWLTDCKGGTPPSVAEASQPGQPPQQRPAQPQRSQSPPPQRRGTQQLPPPPSSGLSR